jgi:hypothetical protein
MEISEFVGNYSKDLTHNGANVPVVHGLLHLTAALVNHGSIQHYWAQSFENFNRVALAEVQASTRALTDRLHEFVLETLRVRKVIPEMHRRNPVLREEADSEYVKKYFLELVSDDTQRSIKVVSEIAIACNGDTTAGVLPVIEFRRPRASGVSTWVGGAMMSMLKRNTVARKNIASDGSVKLALDIVNDMQTVDEFTSAKSIRDANIELSLDQHPEEFPDICVTMKKWFGVENLHAVKKSFYSKFLPSYYRSSHDTIQESNVVRIRSYSCVNLECPELPLEKTDLIAVVREMFSVDIDDGKLYSFIKVSPLRSVRNSGDVASEWRACDNDCKLLELQSKVYFNNSILAYLNLCLCSPRT